MHQNAGKDKQTAAAAATAADDGAGDSVVVLLYGMTSGENYYVFDFDGIFIYVSRAFSLFVYLKSNN